MGEGDEVRVNMLANAQDVHLLREIAKWRRANGVDYWRARGILGRFVQWNESGRGGRQVSIDFEHGDEGWHATMTAGHKGEIGGLKVGDDWTLKQAIDVLVAVGYLPQRFSSAYAAGWLASYEDSEHGLTGDDYRAIVPAAL